MNKSITLLPEPRFCALVDGTCTLQPEAIILLDVPQPQTILFSAARFQQALQTQLAYRWQLSAASSIPADEVGLTLRLSPENLNRAESYRLKIIPEGILLEASDEAGLFYGVCTLIQIIHQSGRNVPCLEIRDWPDFSARGVMLDISRDKVPELNTLYDLIDRLASWKVNQIQLYTEHSFAYRNHQEVWANASPLTGEEILLLDAYCRARYIELVPNQNSFGHMAHWLRLERYAPLAELNGEIQTPWGETLKGPFGLAPQNPGSFELVTSLYDELLPHFSSRKFNVGCDETFDLGQGQSKEAVVERGVGRVYLDFLQKIYGNVSGRGYTMQFWGDIILQHPELVPELPKDAIGLLWGYEGNHPFDKQGKQFAEAGLPFYVCPGTSSWLSLAGRTENAIENQRKAAESGLKHGAIGYLNTDWGDQGHWQMLPISYLGLGLGAAYAWCYHANRDMDIAEAIGQFAFEDRSGTMGRVAYNLGNVYAKVGICLNNSTVFFHLLNLPLDRIVTRPEVKLEILNQALHFIDEAIQPLAQERMARMDADLIRREFLFTARLMRHACYRGYLALEQDSKKAAYMNQQMSNDIKEIIDEYRLLWAARNRPGGLARSLRRFEAIQQEYTSRLMVCFAEGTKAESR